MSEGYARRESRDRVVASLTLRAPAPTFGSVTQTVTNLALVPARGWAAQSAETPLAPIAFERRTPRGEDVVIDVAWCGICHSDIHIARNEWHHTTYPCVPGHEIVGRVREVGSDVTRFAAGDTVGVGCLIDSCRTCEQCQRGFEQHCQAGVTMTYNSYDKDFEHATFGGYSTTIVAPEHFVLRIPPALDPAAAAPILCAGITMWSPLRQHNVGPGTRVGIAGLGGLGLMGIKLAAALGAEVTAITRSPAKAETAKRAGADHVVVSTDRDALKQARSSLDLIIDAVPVAHPLEPYLKLLDLDGTLVLVGAIEPFDGLDARLLYAKRSVTASMIGGLPATQEVLDFCAEHGITADIETIAADGINDAYERVAAGEVDFRFVVDIATI